ncbi:MAG: hypothetical protein NT167_19565 [Verrucomicrobia bacterium]|nr:hypothetical protein [Verrucomicrobiota bacterium]
MAKRIGKIEVAISVESIGTIVGLAKFGSVGRGGLSVALVLQVFPQPLGDVLRLLHRQLLQSIPDFRDCAHARALRPATRFANPNYPAGDA